MADISSLTGDKKKGGLIKWVVIILIILVVLWYLYSKGYLPF